MDRPKRRRRLQKQHCGFWVVGSADTGTPCPAPLAPVLTLSCAPLARLPACAVTIPLCMRARCGAASCRGAFSRIRTGARPVSSEPWRQSWGVGGTVVPAAQPGPGRLAVAAPV